MTRFVLRGLAKSADFVDNTGKTPWEETILSIKLIAFDLDGTMLDSRKGLPEANRRALIRAAEQGVLLVPATGRILRGIPAPLRELPFLRYYILANGAAVVDSQTGRCLYEAKIPLELALRFYDYADSLPVLYDCYQDEDSWMSQAMFERLGEYFTWEPKMIELMELLRTRVPDFKGTLRQLGLPLSKMQLYFRPEDEPERQRQLRLLPELFPELIATTSMKNNIELNSVEATKGRALLALARELGLRREETAAFGDGSNDIAMLRAAGTGIAMANSQPGVKEAADRVTGTNDEAGVGLAIDALLDENRG